MEARHMAAEKFTGERDAQHRLRVRTAPSCAHTHYRDGWLYY